MAHYTITTMLSLPTLPAPLKTTNSNNNYNLTFEKHPVEAGEVEEVGEGEGGAEQRLGDLWHHLVVKEDRVTKQYNTMLKLIVVNAKWGETTNISSTDESEVRFVNALTVGGCVKFLPAV